MNKPTLEDQVTVLQEVVKSQNAMILTNQQSILDMTQLMEETISEMTKLKKEPLHGKN